MQPDQPVAAGLFAVLLLVLANAFFVAAEFALVGARRTRLDEMGRAGDRKARLARRAVQSLDRYISATQLGITLASLGLGWVGEPALARVVEGGFRWLPATMATIATHAVAVAIAFTIITVLHIILGELVPKAFALLYPEEVSGWVAAPLMAFAWVMALPIWILNSTANAILRLFRIKRSGEHDRLHSPEEIRLLVEQSQEAGSLQQQDARLLEGVFEFTEKTAEEVMTPRTEMVALDADLSAGEAADRVAEARRSRYPVFTESLDDIVGVASVRDVLEFEGDPAESIEGLTRQVFLVPETKKIAVLLRELQAQRSTFAVAIDEYGGTAGIVSVEDIVEELVGEIKDEYDVESEPISVDEHGAVVVAGRVNLERLAQALEIPLEADADVGTVGGFVTTIFGHIPKVGEKTEHGGFLVEVLDAERKRVNRVRFTRAPVEVDKS